LDATDHPEGSGPVEVGSRGDTRVVGTGSGVLKDTRCASGIPLMKNSVTDPAELIAAAHAGSFSLALSRELKLAPSALGNIITTRDGDG